MSKKNLFIFDKKSRPHIHKEDIPEPEDCNEKEPSPKTDQNSHTGQLNREARLHRFDEQILTMIAISAAPARWLWRKARMKAFKAAMQQLEFYIGPTGCENCPESNCEFALYCQFLQQLLRVWVRAEV